MFTHYGFHYNPTTFKIWYPPCSRTHSQWTEEIKASAIMLSQSVNKDIWICMSGGIDSETVARTFKDLKIPFKAFIAKFNDDLNKHDITYAQRWCEYHNIEYKLFDFNIINFLKVGYKEYISQNLVSNNVFRYFSIELLKQIENMNGFGILGGKSVGLNLLQLPETSSDFSVHDSYDIGSLAPIEWCRKNNLNHCVFFYQTSPEIHKAYLDDPVNQLLIQHPYMLRSGSSNEAAKTLMMRSHFPIAVPRSKFHGFEKIMDLREETQIDMAQYFNLDTKTAGMRFKRVYYNNHITIPIGEVLKQLSND
jgi:hypothetical protein